MMNTGVLNGSAHVMKEYIIMFVPLSYEVTSSIYCRRPQTSHHSFQNLTTYYKIEKGKIHDVNELS